ncbi:hypothetical protein D3C83_75930 [compost metagenome]
MRRCLTFSGGTFRVAFENPLKSVKKTAACLFMAGISSDDARSGRSARSRYSSNIKSRVASKPPVILARLTGLLSLLTGGGIVEADPTKRIACGGCVDRAV